jgi:hypothetical protein
MDQTLDLCREASPLTDGVIVLLIIGEGRSIFETAQRLYGQPSTRDVGHTARRLRESVATLAGRWFKTQGRTTAFRSFARADSFQFGLINMPIGAVHASRERIS